MSTLKVNNITDLGDDAVVTSGVLDTLAVPAGGILQVVHATTTSETTIATETLTDTTLKATITPSSISSKVIILCSLQTRSQRTSSAVTSDIAIDRSGSIIFQNISRALGGSAVGTTSFQVDAYQSLSYIDSPNTTSATEYTILAAPGTTANSGTLVVQSTGQPSSIILMEVAG